MDLSYLNKLGLALLLCFQSHANQPPVTLAAVISHAQELRNATDFRASGRLVRIDGAQRKSYQISMRAKASAGVLRVFCEVTDPASSRVRILLESFPDGKIRIRTGHAGDPAPTEFPFERWGERLLDTDFTAEDLLESQFLWKNQSLGEQGMFGARPSVVLKSLPGPQDKTHYSTVNTWLDREILYPLKEVKVAKVTGTLREFVFYGLRQSKGVWSASQIECKTVGKPGSSLLIITRGSAVANSADSSFDPTRLIK
jgi:hypothetical protein